MYIHIGMKVQIPEYTYIAMYISLLYHIAICTSLVTEHSSLPSKRETFHVYV